MTKINGGAVLWARQTIESDIFFNKPSEWFKIWFYIVQKVNHKDNKHFKRGEGYFNFNEDKQNLKNITAHQWHECIKWLKWTKQITTQKTTRGNIIFVLNYDKFQTLKNYKTDTQTDTQTEAEPKQNRSRTDTIYKNDKNDKNEILYAPAGAEEVFNSNSYVETLTKDKRKHIVLIGEYFKLIGIEFPSKKAAQAEIRRWVRDATALAEYPKDKINIATEYVVNKFPNDWKLSTILKYINDNRI